MEARKYEGGAISINPNGKKVVDVMSFLTVVTVIVLKVMVVVVIVLKMMVLTMRMTTASQRNVDAEYS